jgi:hypothetical protein
MILCLEPMTNRNKEREENNRLKDSRRETQEEAKEVGITTQQSITHNRWKGFNTIFNSPISYQVFQPIEEEKFNYYYSNSC